MFWGITFKISFVIAGVGHMVDTSATQRCLGARACTELNAFLARFENPVGFAIAKGAVGGATEIVIFDFTKDNKPLGVVTNVSLGTFFTWLGIRNWNLTKDLINDNDTSRTTQDIRSNSVYRSGQTFSISKTISR